MTTMRSSFSGLALALAIPGIANATVPAALEVLKPPRIVLYGVATDVCDKYAIEGLLERAPQAEIDFVVDAARAIHVDAVDDLLESWRRRGVRMLTAAEILAGGA